MALKKRSSFKMAGFGGFGQGTGFQQGVPQMDPFGMGGNRMASPDQETMYNKNKPGAVYKKEEKAYGGTRTWGEGEEAAGKHGLDLNALVKQRKQHTKGSAEYNVVQNKINQALGSKKRHTEGAHRSSKTDTSSKVVYKDEDTKNKIKTKETGYGTKEKIVTKGPEGTTKTVVKRDHEGDVIGTRGYDTTSKNKDKKKLKDTGVGKFLGVGQGGKRKAARAARKAKNEKTNNKSDIFA
jgi:hypothetical protein